MADVQWESLRPVLQDIADRLAEIERFLAVSGYEAPVRPPAGSIYSYRSADSFAPPQGFATAADGIAPDAMPQPSPAPGLQVPEHVMEMVRSGKHVRAIQAYRDATGVSMREAKFVIDQMMIRPS